MSTVTTPRRMLLSRTVSSASDRRRSFSFLLVVAITQQHIPLASWTDAYPRAHVVPLISRV